MSLFLLLGEMIIYAQQPSAYLILFQFSYLEINKIISHELPRHAGTREQALTQTTALTEIIDAIPKIKSGTREKPIFTSF